MSRPYLRAALFVAVVACVLTSVSFNRHRSTVAHAQATEPPTLALGTRVQGFSLPVGFAHADDRTNRLYVVEQGGRVRIVKSGVVNPSPFLNF